MQLEDVANKRGFTVMGVTGSDGCMFATMIRQFEILGFPSHSAYELRHSIATFMEQHSERYKPFMCLNVDNTMNDTEPVTEEDSAIEQILDPDDSQEQL